MGAFEETKFIMKKYGISANKSLGQNFLINDEVVTKIIEKAEISKEDLVIEIGPGLGTLTKKLLKHAGKVIAIELDKRMIEILIDTSTITLRISAKVNTDMYFRNSVLSPISDITFKK